VSIFRRRKGTTEAIEDPTPEVASGGDDGAADEPEAPVTVDTPEVIDTAVAPTGSGPFDAAEVDARDDGRLDLGALRIRGVGGMELRLEVDEQAQQVVGATAVIGDSAVQLQAFAAPRTAGVWDEIREEIARSIVSQGGTADDVRGELGRELRTRMPSAGPDGRTVYAPARFVGVDGPRWFLRAVFSGRAAIEDDAAAPLMEVVRDTVVVRGDAAMAPREMLPLRLPEETAPTGDPQGAEDVDGQPRRANDLKPFERGPEITEVR
jgi:hypothetical protein